MFMYKVFPAFYKRDHEACCAQIANLVICVLNWLYQQKWIPNLEDFLFGETSSYLEYF